MINLDSSVLDLNTYKTKTFYFTEAFSNIYNYSCSDTDGDGIIDNVQIY